MNPQGKYDKSCDDRVLVDKAEGEVTKSCLNGAQKGENSLKQPLPENNIAQAILEITKLDIPDIEKSRLIDHLLKHLLFN